MSITIFFLVILVSLLLVNLKSFQLKVKLNSISKINLSNESKDESKPKGITLSNIIQLVLMGAGAPGLGEYKGTDPETGKMFFELEANNLVDSKGNDIQTRAKFFKDGWVEGSSEDLKAPGFFENLLSGGKLQREWDDKYRNRK